MSDAVAIAALGMTEDLQRMAAVSHNLANATTPGYKREVVSRTAFPAFLAAAGPAGLQAGVAPAVPLVSSLDMRPGPQRVTGRALDVALEHESAFFEVQGPEGALYTRQGDFQVDARGRLITAGGLPVMGSSGEIYLNGGEPRIDREGRVYEGERLVARLRVVTFAAPSALAKTASGVYAATEDNPPLAAEARVRQGYLEASNVTTVGEMVRMIETVRHFEAGQKLIQGYDEVLERAIRNLGETN